MIIFRKFLTLILPEHALSQHAQVHTRTHPHTNTNVNSSRLYCGLKIAQFLIYASFPRASVISLARKRHRH